MFRLLVLVAGLAFSDQQLFSQSINQPGTVSISIDAYGLFFGSLGLHVEYRVATEYALGMTTFWNYDRKVELKQTSDLIVEPFFRTYGSGVQTNNWNLGVEAYAGIGFDFQHKFMNFPFGCGFAGNFGFLPYVFISPALDVQYQFGHDQDLQFRLSAPEGFFL